MKTPGSYETWTRHNCLKVAQGYKKKSESYSSRFEFDFFYFRLRNSVSLGITYIYICHVAIAKMLRINKKNSNATRTLGRDVSARAG